jgi:hypothetical protein
MEDDEGTAAFVSPDEVKTKNEVADVHITIPDVEEVDAGETLEKVGEVLSIVDKVVIVKGLPQQVQGRASDRALDSDTLLVFEDRKVLGYVSPSLILVAGASTQRAILRSGKPSVQLVSHFTGYSLATLILQTPTKCTLRAKSITFPLAASLSLLPT